MMMGPAQMDLFGLGLRSNGANGTTSSARSLKSKLKYTVRSDSSTAKHRQMAATQWMRSALNLRSTLKYTVRSDSSTAKHRQLAATQWMRSALNHRSKLKYNHTQIAERPKWIR